MEKPSPDLIEAFFKWYRTHDHSTGEDAYAGIIARDHLASLSDKDFVEFCYQFARDGGRLQTGGTRTASRFRKAIEEKLSEFREFVLEPFNDGFDEIPWLERTRDFFGFGKGLSTIYLNRIDKNRFAIVNNKAEEAYELLGVDVPSGRAEAYVAIRDAQRQLIAWYPEFENHFRADALTEFLIGQEEGEPWADRLRGTSGRESSRYWVYAPGENARLWPAHLRDGVMAIGWDELREDLAECESDKELKAQYERAYGDDATGVDYTQVRDFVRRVTPGDHVFVKKGRRAIVGYGTVKSPYSYDPSRQEYHHLHEVEWQKSGEWPLPASMRSLPMKTLTEVRDPERVRDLLALIGGAGASAKSSETYLPAGVAEHPFTETTFSLLKQLHANPTRAFYNEHVGEFEVHVETPLQDVMRAVAERLPATMRDTLETRSGVFSRIVKNDYGRGGAWDFYWGALYPRGGKRIADPQLYLTILPEFLAFGFYIGDYAKEPKARFVTNCEKSIDLLKGELDTALSDPRLHFGSVSEGRTYRHPAAGEKRIRWEEWLENPEVHGIRVAVVLPTAEAIASTGEQIVSSVATTFQQLFPLFLLAASANPIPAITDYLELDTAVPAGRNAEYSLEACAADTYLEIEELQRWLRAFDRKKQGIFYGPPGTGKTFIAEKLGRHLIGGGDGFCETVQFHPSYAYEDFIQGLRPKTVGSGRLEYVMVPGRFKDFCARARTRSGTCVLIIDEINRANLSRVLGELMYLLEYRDKEVPLAGGELFRIPDNVRIVGTMNTADRSIALVDHALRRRFAFLSLYPNYEVLKRYHAGGGFDPTGLIEVLHRVNVAIDDPHYSIGISYFLRRDIAQHIEDIWCMEIEPYLEELFFDQLPKAEKLYWQNVRGEILGK